MSERHLILVVDDEVDNCRLLSRVFRRKYDVVEAYAVSEFVGRYVLEVHHRKIRFSVSPGVVRVEHYVEFYDLSLTRCPFEITPNDAYGYNYFFLHYSSQ